MQETAVSKKEKSKLQKQKQEKKSNITREKDSMMTTTEQFSLDMKV